MIGWCDLINQTIARMTWMAKTMDDRQVTCRDRPSLINLLEMTLIIGWLEKV